MKKIVAIVAILMLALQANAAMSYKDAIAQNDRKPMAVLVYANWAQNYDYTLTMYRKMQSSLGNLYNYVELDLASAEAKDYTEDFAIMPKLPYIMLYRGKGKFQRLLDRNCATDLNCAIPKMKSFSRQ